MQQRTSKMGCSSKASPSENIRVREEIMSGGNGTLGRKENCQLELFKKGAKIWIKDNELVWARAEIINDLNFNSSSILVKRLSDKEEIEYDVLKNGLPFLCNPDILLGKDDLTHLSYLHEPGVLNNLQYRFQQLQKIYTYSGVALVAINPYEDCSSIYSEDIVSVYRGQGSQVRNLIPHVFGVAEEAFNDLREYGNNQSIIVSGESGAGKTVNAKFIMKYLTHVTSSGQISENGIEQRVLASNPVMEAFGNAKTIRNDNSSRFGKFIQINFNSRFSINGAEMKTYLLEKTRVVIQSKGERNYHVLYQMCAHNNHSLLVDLDLCDASQYFYTNQGALTIDGVDDKDDFLTTIKALTQLQVSESQQRDVFRLLAGLLFLGNVDFVANGEYAQVCSSSKQWLDKFCSIYSVDCGEIENWLCAREMKAGTETLSKCLNVQESVNNRDAVVKLIYASVFNFIVARINENLMAANKDKNAFVGVLDIYGFETFELNSFEQFCINFANENLQQTFNRHVFKLEQAEYKKEEIPFESIVFYDNEKCIDLISNLISMLDEQCKTGHGSDQDWLLQMENAPQMKNSEHLQIPKVRSSSFIVKHYASDVKYHVDGFVKKNQDAVNEKLLETVADKTKFEFMRQLMSPVLGSLSVGSKRKKTVGIQFRDSLRDLSSVINATRPHYVRCIKPNDEKKSFCFEPRRSIEQLRACGVLETVRISSTGYPSRWTYIDFFKRYRVLFIQRNLESKEFAKIVCNKFLSADTFAFGKTKVFMKVGEIAKFETIRQEKLYTSALRIQTCYRRFIAQRKYRQLLKMHHAAIRIQAFIRGAVQQRKYQLTRAAILQIQSRFRALVVRKKFLRMRYEKSAVVIQRCVRGYFVRRERIAYVRKVIVVQSCIRRWLAKRELRKLKVEAKSVNHLQNLNRDMANKLIELHERLESFNHERENLNTSAAIIEVEFSEAKSTIEDLQKQLEHATEELTKMRQTKEELATNYANLNISLVGAKLTISNLEKEKHEAWEMLKEKSGQLDSMREQLVKNADLLISPDFRGEISFASSPARTNSSLSSGEVQLLLEQQSAIQALRRKFDRLLRIHEHMQNDMNAQQLSDSPLFKIQDLQKIQNLELLNNKYQAELEEFATTASKGDDFDSSFLEHYKRLREENERIQDENIGLRSLLTQMFEKKTSVRDSAYWSANSSDDGLSHNQSCSEIDEHLSTDRLLRQYRVALGISNQTIKTRDDQISQLEELHQLTNDEENQPTADSKTVANLINHNLILQQRLDNTTQELTSARAYLTGNSSSLSEQFSDDQSTEKLQLESLSSNGYFHSGLLEVFNVPEFAKILIYDLKPRLAIKLRPCLPAYLILSGFRYYDHANNDSLISNLFNAIHLILKDISTSAKDDFDIQVLWLINVWRLLNLLRQYCAVADCANNEWVEQNTEKQDSQRMLNFNFEPIRKQLELRVDELYRNFVKNSIEPILTPKISPGILHHESGLTLPGEKTQHGKLSREPSKDTSAQSLDDLKEFLSIVYTKLEAFGADKHLVSSVFTQLSHWICSLAMNQLVFRKDLCTFEKAIQIKHNVMDIKSWLEERKLDASSIEPLIQSSHLIMSKKTESNLEVLAGEMTSRLTSKQVISILTTYNPPDGFEEDSVDSNFIIKLSKRLEERDQKDNDSAIMPGTFLKPFETQRFVYSPEDIQKLTLPSCLKLDSIARFV